MKMRNSSMAGFLTGSVLLAFLASCAIGNRPDAVQYWNARVIFPDATINGQPIRIHLDTGFSGSRLFEQGVRLLNLKPAAALSQAEHQEKALGTWLTEPVRVRIGAEEFVSEFPVFPARLTPQKGFDFDGVIGWTEVQSNNILFFDSTRRTVTSLDKLPESLTDWLKLKIHPESKLFLEVPLSNGQTGNVLVDTGGDYGIALPPAEYAKWRAAHPTAPTLTKPYYQPGSGYVSTEQCWAEKIEIGSLALTDVQVRPANADEISWVDNFAGVLALYSLERMDLIVDEKAGFAYVHSKPPPGPPYPGYHRLSDKNYALSRKNGVGDWTVDRSVQVKIDGFLVGVALCKAEVADYDGASRDIERAISLNPKSLRPYFFGSRILRQKGDFGAAVTLLSRLIENEHTWLNPEEISYIYYERGVDRQILDDDQGALADYSASFRLDSDSYPGQSALILRQLILTKLQQPLGDFPQIVAGWPNPWRHAIGEFIAGTLSEADFFHAAQADADAGPGRLCQAFYFSGVQHLLRGDTASAREFLEKCVATNLKDYDEYELARAALPQLNRVAPQ